MPIRQHRSSFPLLSPIPIQSKRNFTLSETFVGKFAYEKNRKEARNVGFTERIDRISPENSGFARRLLVGRAMQIDACVIDLLLPSMDRYAYIRMLLMSILAASSLGCAGLKSRYAMDNEVYAQKYSQGAEKSDVLGKLKQASDARWVEGQHGTFVGGGALNSPDSGSWLGSFSVGYEEYGEPWFCLLYTSPSPRDGLLSRMPSSA